MNRQCPQNSVYTSYIADGFADDCEELIHRCSRVDILSYQTFCIYYKDMNFASVFQGRTSNSEIAELSEELLHVAKHYMVRDTSNFEESVAGLFLVYALLSLQPYPRFAHLRVTPDELPALGRLTRVARRERRLDVLYVMGAVLARGPVHYHAAARERGLDASLRKYLEGPCAAEQPGARPRGVYYRQNEELDAVRELAGVFQKYGRAKDQIPGLKMRNLKYSNDNLANELETSLRRLINGITDEETEPVDHYNAVQEIKSRAMRGAVGAMRHLAPVALRSPEKTPPSNLTSPTKSPKPSTANGNSTPKPKKPKLTKINSSSSEEAKEICTKKVRSSASVSFEQHNVETSEQGSRAGLGSLPTIATEETEYQPVEIKIENTQAKMKGKAAKADDAIFKKPLKMSPKTRVRSKRDMKKPILKSKFKKMGMLPIANFEDK